MSFSSLRAAVTRFRVSFSELSLSRLLSRRRAAELISRQIRLISLLTVAIEPIAGGVPTP
jgi:hypothetical protein